VTICYKETPTIEISSEIKGKLYAAELVLKALEIPYKIVKSPSPDYWINKINRN